MKLFHLISTSFMVAQLLTSGTTFGQREQDAKPSYSPVQYASSRTQAEQVLEETRGRLHDMIQSRGGNPQIILLTGDMVRNWKTAKQAFDSGDYAETIRICNIIQKYIF